MRSRRLRELRSLLNAYLWFRKIMLITNLVLLFINFNSSHTPSECSVRCFLTLPYQFQLLQWATDKLGAMGHRSTHLSLPTSWDILMMWLNILIWANILMKLVKMFSIYPVWISTKVSYKLVYSDSSDPCSILYLIWRIKF